MIDTHAHLDFENFDEDREEVISRAFDNGVKKIINVGVDLERSRKSVEIAQKHENIFAAVGFHPEFFNEQGTVTSEQKNIFDDLKKLARNKKVVAIGEIGLDYFRIVSEKSSHLSAPAGHLPSGRGGGLEEIKENQKKGFLVQIELAQELGLPVIVHCRDAWRDLFEIISKFLRSDLKNQKFVLHCYSGNKKDTEKFLELDNVSFSFSGNITYPKPIERAEKLAEAVKMIPLGKIMLDSDCPFLAPQEMRGKRNEPAYIKYIAEKIAEIKGISVAEVEKATDENAEKFFKISTNRAN